VSLSQLEAACRRHGVPLTVQRRVVLEALAGRTDHPTADQLLVDVRTRLPGVSRTTVYRVLETLVRLELAVKTCTPGSTVRFDPRTERHHHLVCLQCERVLDVHAPSLDALRFPTVRSAGFEISDYSVHFRGTCPECRRRGRAPATRRRPRPGR
jgi:Fur family peroxide stress response transcriptional regulator